ncbi:MAG TPA: hypothetical protein VFB54_09745 [Burkholderiales bacterium]|nr:hypothetical protein [Burkholderiales bacterium]
MNRFLPFFGPDTSLLEVTQERFAQYVDHVLALDGAHSTKVGYVHAVTSMFSWHRGG